MRKLAPTVEQVLAKHPKSRNSDNDLLARTWYALGLELTEEQYNKLMTLPSPESITRIRRKLQEQGKYKASKAVQGERSRKAQEIQQNAPTANAERLQSLL